jgi:hypothetical protein
MWVLASGVAGYCSLVEIHSASDGVESASWVEAVFLDQMGIMVPSEGV